MGCSPTQRPTWATIIWYLEPAQLLGWPWWVWSWVWSETSHLPGAQTPGPSSELLHPQPANRVTYTTLASPLQLQQDLEEHLAGEHSSVAPAQIAWDRMDPPSLSAGDVSEQPRSSCSDPAAAPRSDSSADHSPPPAPVPNRRQRARVIFKIKLYSFGNKNIESAHQCTSSHLKTAEHISHKVFRGKGDDPSHQGRCRRGTQNRSPPCLQLHRQPPPRGHAPAHDAAGPPSPGAIPTAHKYHISIQEKALAPAFVPTETSAAQAGC